MPDWVVWGKLSIFIAESVSQPHSMKKFLLLLVFPAFLFSCKGKKTSMADSEERISPQDFIEFFQPLELPYLTSDTIFRHKDAEATLINNKIFLRLVPDSVLTKYFGKEGKPRLHAVGRVTVPKSETYLFVKATTAARKVLYIICFDKKDQFAAARPVLYSDNEPGYSGLVSMDAKYTLTLTHQRKGPDGQAIYRKDAFVFNDAAGFMLILTESNEGKGKIPPIYNPIDTFSHKHKFTGDYLQDKRNIISFRDGRDPSRIQFFVHFEKEEGTCKGELKGEAKFISPNVARFHSNGDPCMVEFTFKNGDVVMKELDGCGNHRDIKCYFEGYFEKKKVKSPAPKSKN